MNKQKFMAISHLSCLHMCEMIPWEFSRSKVSIQDAISYLLYIALGGLPTTNIRGRQDWATIAPYRKLQDGLLKPSVYCAVNFVKLASLSARYSPLLDKWIIELKQRPITTWGRFLRRSDPSPADFPLDLDLWWREFDGEIHLYWCFFCLRSICPYLVSSNRYFNSTFHSTSLHLMPAMFASATDTWTRLYVTV